MHIKKIINILLIIFTVGIIASCDNNQSNSVVFYSNADDEAVVAMENALKNNGYDGKYIFQSLGSSELGGKMFAEGKNIEADFVTMASYYVDSAQEEHKMFKDLDFPVNSIQKFPKYQAPTTSQEGSIFINTKLIASKNLPIPHSIKDLANPIYKGLISVADINSSTTAWLFIQAIIDSYGMGEEGKKILTDIYRNAGNHIESSGSGPIKKVRAGEVAIGFGLRHQAVADHKAGLPIDYIDPIEGNFSLIEVIAVIDKGDKTNPLAMEMVKTIVENARPELMQYYPNAVYLNESVDTSTVAKYPKIFPQPLTIDLLKEHIEFSELCKKEAQM